MVKKDQDIPAEAEKIMARMVKMPPQQHEDMKAGARQSKAAATKDSGVSASGKKPKPAS